MLKPPYKTIADEIDDAYCHRGAVLLSLIRRFKLKLCGNSASTRYVYYDSDKKYVFKICDGPPNRSEWGIYKNANTRQKRYLAKCIYISECDHVLVMEHLGDKCPSWIIINRLAPSESSKLFPWFINVSWDRHPQNVRVKDNQLKLIDYAGEDETCECAIGDIDNY